MNPRGQRRLWKSLALVGCIGGVLALATAASRHIFETPGDSETGAHPVPQVENPATSPANDTNAQFRVASLEGTVETLHAGQWYTVQAGDQIATTDILRTARGGRAILRRGSTEIEIKENVDIRLDQVTAQTPRFDVLRGAITASVTDPKEELQITARGAQARNEGSARFIVALDLRGQVRVAAMTGAVRFSNAGAQVSLGAGEESVAAPGESPMPPQAIPDELVLSVFWPDDARPERSAPLAGQVAPSTRVMVNGHDVPVDNTGKFHAPVDLAVGPNNVRVEAEDILGRKKSVTHMVDRVPRAPTLETKKGPLWEP